MIGFMPRPVTEEELRTVELATKGETIARRQFPPEADAAWLAAEVVRAGAATWGMRDASAVPVTRAR